jgi:RimJ/RimL family protein N-acetyltransferase
MSGEVQLRDVTEADLPVLFEHQRDPEAVRMAAFASRDRDAFAAHWKRLFADPNVLKKVILYDGQLAGNVMSFERGGEQLVGYWIGKEYWGRGVASRALATFLAEVETRRPLHARVAKHNRASLRILQKSGFEIRGEDRIVDLPGGDVEEFVLKLEAADAAD